MDFSTMDLLPHGCQMAAEPLGISSLLQEGKGAIIKGKEQKVEANVLGQIPQKQTLVYARVSDLPGEWF